MKPIVDWDKLAARAGFEDGATAKAHYEPLLNRDNPSDAPRKQQTLRNIKPKTLETEDGNKRYARKSFVSRDPYDLEDGEV
ncbi:hypothetical protein F5B22DRAFT_46079 [Xylaria bambusicola]|uniref:uncharacterized protein n=1 Tax=Xylaria bambusicola TaxID=326684 RepID=UPI002008B2C7|nr:uncharacterized protein F5B22DRAFT_46079 [Xylaria bambusicola]KAI0502796.1 hypothetical protein F5B22DRAFT_46079 [Xylaria bambusicola]